MLICGGRTFKQIGILYCLILSYRSFLHLLRTHLFVDSNENACHKVMHYLLCMYQSNVFCSVFLCVVKTVFFCVLVQKNLWHHLVLECPY